MCMAISCSVLRSLAHPKRVRFFINGHEVNSPLHQLWCAGGVTGGVDCNGGSLAGRA